MAWLGNGNKLFKELKRGRVYGGELPCSLLKMKLSSVSVLVRATSSVSTPEGCCASGCALGFVFLQIKGERPEK